MGSIKAFIVSGTSSGVGKTTIALGLMAALGRRGLSVAPFKVGPDFIDPGHHAWVTGRASRNLDGWMLSREYNQTCFRRHAAGCDVAVVEGVMGLYDGFSGQSEEGSTAQIAKWLNLPVLLVVDGAGLARSAAALVQGFEHFDAQVRFAGVLFNNLGSTGHLDYLKEAMAAYVDVPVLGGIVRDDGLRMPERHLGLVTAEERPLDAAFLQRLADRVERGVDLDQLLARLPEMTTAPPAEERPQADPLTVVRIGVARDAAFCFYYPDNLDLLCAAGAQLVPFSPVSAARLADDLDGLYLGGGYPELHAGRLAANADLRLTIQRRSREGMPIYAECGGFMYLCRELKDQEGSIYPMCGCFPFRTQMNRKLRTLGYREIRLEKETLLGGPGALLRGHEFHYSHWVEDAAASPTDTVYALSGRKGGAPQPEGYALQRTLGSYVHLHFGSRPASAAAFVAACGKYRQECRQRK
ncbi:MAG: cobyrinate a,c-diamide synthase [Desulfatitalea sp.]